MKHWRYRPQGTGLTVENFFFVIPGRVKRGPGIQNRERAALDSGFSYAAPDDGLNDQKFD